MNETSTGSVGGADGGGPSRGGPGEQSPLQARAAFLKNWGWQSVIILNQGACARGGAQHGINSEAAEACRCRWEIEQKKIQSLIEVFDLLRDFHRAAPFLFFNGNTFADIGRRVSLTLFAELPTIRRRELASAVAHYVAGVLDRESMIQAVDSLCQSADLQPGDRIQTLRGSLCGTIIAILPDGRVMWKSDESGSKLTCLPESLRKLPD